MKNLFILLVLCLSLLTACLTTKLIPVSFSEPIVKTYDANFIKDVLFINANRWMISEFKDAKSVIQYSDKTAGTLMGKYLLYYKPAYISSYINTPEENVYAIIEITVKDGRARISIKPDSWTNKQFTDMNGNAVDSYSQAKAAADIDALCESFRKSLSSEDIKF